MCFLAFRYLPSLWFHRVGATDALEPHPRLPACRGGGMVPGGRRRRVVTAAVNWWHDMRFDCRWVYFQFLQRLATRSLVPALRLHDAPGPGTLEEDERGHVAARAAEIAALTLAGAAADAAPEHAAATAGTASTPDSRAPGL